MAQKRSLNVAIIGAGMSGLCMAAKLQDAGIDTYTIFETADEVGGTWRDNTYPGLSLRRPVALLLVLVPAQPGWSHFMPPGPRSSLLPAGRDRARHPPAHPVRHRGHLRPIPGRAVVGRALTTGEEAVRRPHHGDRRAADPALSRHPWARQLRRPVVSLRALGPFDFVAGQADRIDRHGFHRRADHRGARRQSARPQDLSTHGAVGVADAKPAVLAVHQGGAAALARP